MTHTRVLALALLLAATGTSHADDLIWGNAYRNPWSSWDAYQYKRVEEEAADASRPHRPLSATDFKPPRQRGRPALDRYVAASGFTGAEADAVRAALETMLGHLESQVRKHNVATAMGVLVAASRYAVDGVELDAAAQDRLVAGFNDVLAADPRFRKLAARDKQLLTDTMLVQAAAILMLAAAGQTDPAARSASETLGRSALAFLTGSDPGP